MQKFQIKDLNVYSIEPKFLKFYRQNSDSVYCRESHDFKLNRYFGIIATNGEKELFIPIIPGKKKHIDWKKKHFDGNFLITEPINKEDIKHYQFYQKTENPDIVLLIYSNLAIQKMLPILKDNYELVEDFKNTEEKVMLEQTLKFIKENKDKIEKNINHIYKEMINCPPEKFTRYKDRTDIGFLEKIMTKYDKDKELSALFFEDFVL